MQRKMNVNIKYRESFRPFAPSVLAEDAEQYFELHGNSSPYMLLVAGVRSEYRKPAKQAKLINADGKIDIVALGMSVNEEVEKETTGGLAGKAKSLE